MQQTSNNIGFEEFVSQVLSHLRPRLLIMLKEELELSLIHLRDKIIGNRRYKRGRISSVGDLRSGSTSALLWEGWSRFGYRGSDRRSARSECLLSATGIFPGNWLIKLF